MVGMDIGCLSIFIIIMIAYFAKKKVRTIETFLYSSLIIIVFLNYILEGIMYVIPVLGYEPNQVTIRLYFNFLASQGLLFLLYNIYKILKFKYDTEDKKIKTIYKYFLIPILILFIISFVFISFFPVEIKYVGDWAYGESDSILVISFWFVSAALIFNYAFIRFFKKITSKDKAYYTGVILCLLVIPTVRLIAPYITISNIVSSAMCIVMFFTIENPDVDTINEMKRLNDVKSNFLSSMSHELKTPLNAIVGLASVPADNYESLKEDVDTIYQESLLLLDMFTNIININVVDTENVKVNYTEFNVRELFNSIYNKFNSRFTTKGLSLKYSIDERLPNVIISDYEKINDIVSNLLSNALKFTSEGYAELILSLDQRPNENFLKVEVRDTGKGISPEDYKILFSEFGKGKNEVNSNISGLGIGLSLCKILADSLNGKITVGSQEGSGSTFLLEIPIQIKNA